ncbi:MAG: hypothetical protein AAGI01_05745 [Myxococcota bacterium]
MSHDIAAGTSLQLLHDGDVRRALDGISVQAWHYTVNERFQLLLLGVALVCALLAAALGILTQLSTSLAFWGTALAGGVAVALGVYLWRWREFAKRSFVAVGDEHFYVGDNRRAWKISWALLDRDSMGLTQMEASKFMGELLMSPAGQQVSLRLYHPLVLVEDLPGLIGSILQHIDLGALEDAEGLYDLESE